MVFQTKKQKEKEVSNHIPLLIKLQGGIKI